MKINSIMQQDCSYKQSLKNKHMHKSYLKFSNINDTVSFSAKNKCHNQNKTQKLKTLLMGFVALLSTGCATLTADNANENEPCGVILPANILTNEDGIHIAVIDDIICTDTDLNGDRRPDISHGKTVYNIIKALRPDADVAQFDIKGCLTSFDDYLKNTNCRFDAINLSISMPISINELRKKTGLKINRKNIDDPGFKELILKYAEEKYKGVNEAIEALEYLTSQGVKVFVAAGNSGPNNINLLSFAEGVITVGALDKKGRVADYSCNNALVDEFAPGYIHLKVVKDDKGRAKGYDINEDGEIDILLSESARWAKDKDIRGTSFASPLALVTSLEEQNNRILFAQN